MPRCDNTKQEQTDLSGTYTGKLKHGDGPTVDATLTVTGNTFTGTVGNESPHGKITAVTTCGYTAVTMMMDGARRLRTAIFISPNRYVCGTGARAAATAAFAR